MAVTAVSLRIRIEMREDRVMPFGKGAAALMEREDIGQPMNAFVPDWVRVLGIEKSSGLPFRPRDEQPANAELPSD